MEEWLKLLLQSNVVAAFVVGAFGVVTLKMGLGKFRSEKWWERRTAAYVSAIEAMHAVYAGSKSNVDAARAGYTLTDAYQSRLYEASLTGIMEVRKAASIGRFLMSNRAATIMAELVEQIDSVDDDIEPIIDLHKSK